MEFFLKYWIIGLGFLAQAMFGMRQLVQLVQTERARRVMSPVLFWQLSLVGSFLFLLYGLLRNDIVIILGQFLSFFIYIRNLQLKGAWKNIPVIARAVLVSLPGGLVTITLLTVPEKLSAILSNNSFADPLLVMGAFGQLLLNFRFIYQWYYSEKHKTSLLPLGFWLISAGASVMIILYGIQKEDIVLLVAQSLGIFVYARNIIVHFRSRLVFAPIENNHSLD